MEFLSRRLVGLSSFVVVGVIILVWRDGIWIKILRFSFLFFFFFFKCGIGFCGVVPYFFFRFVLENFEIVDEFETFW